jgi:hypothetical protein
MEEKSNFRSAQFGSRDQQIPANPKVDTESRKI